MNVILSKAKDRTVGMRICYDQLKIDEAKVIRRSLNALSAYAVPLASLGMTRRV
jgi:hypothetical protein